MTDVNDWPQRVLEPLGVSVGPCAWSAAMLAGPHAAYALARPTLIVVGPDEPEATLRAVGPNLHNLPVVLAVREPTFSRRLPDLVQARLALLGLPRVDVVTLWVDQLLDLKAGGMLNVLWGLRERGVTRHVGLALRNAGDAEWAALHTAARLLVFPYHLADQAARYRTLDTAAQYGMSCLATLPESSGNTSSANTLRFALAESPRALPLLDRPLPPGLAAMDPSEVERCWAAYSHAHPAPPPPPRGGPPEGAG